MMRSMRLRFVVASLGLVFAACGSAFAAGAGPAQAASPARGGSGHGSGGAGGGGIWIQTMDSCKQGLGGAAYSVTGPGGASITVTTPPGSAGSVGASAGCPLQKGSCSAGGHGCVSFAAPPPGTYTIRTTVTPPPNATNPEGYAPCEGGSACQSEEATLTVGSGSGTHAIVTAVYPDGSTVTWPSTGGYAGTASDPIVFHDFGLAAPGSGSNSQCDGDGDADDHLTGTPSSRCAFPESQETSACQPYPWSCQLGSGTPGKGGPSGSGGHGSHGSSGGGSSSGGHTSNGGGSHPSSSGGGGGGGGTGGHRTNTSARSIRSS
jgi:hypothetical protein